MPELILFDLPAHDEDQRGAPWSIHHGCDFGRTDTGALDYYYNYLDYRWRVANREVAARAYLDTIETISFAHTADDLDAIGIADILTFLFQRFDTIETLERQGYAARWRRAPAPPA